MRKTLILAVMAIAMSVNANAQVQFSKFKFYVADIMDFSHLQLETKFQVIGKRYLKYVHVYFTPVNSVGDAIVDQIRGGVNANVKHTKFHHIYATGPFEPKKSYTKHFDPYYIGGKKPTPFPYKVIVDYMGGGSDTIRITKDNLKTYFPSLKWIDVDYKSGFQPDN